MNFGEPSEHRKRFSVKCQTAIGKHAIGKQKRLRNVITNVNELTELQAMFDGGFITCRKHPTADLYIYNYTAKAQYDNVWNEATLTCRGLIADGSGVIVSRPFRKFFNLEQVEQLPKEPFEVHEKLDGSLGISYWIDGKMYIATRGSFESEQAKTANRLLKNYNTLPLFPDFTYLFEIVAPEHRVVVDYGQRRELVLLAIIQTATGYELKIDEGLRDAFRVGGFSVAQHYSQVADINQLKGLNLPNSEGFVIRFASGFRVKVKLAEYVRLHKLLTGITEKTILEDYLMTGADLEQLLDRVPDEFNVWVRETVDKFVWQYKAIEATAQLWFSQTKATTRKEYAEVFTQTKYAAILFKMLDGKDYSQLIWKMLTPQRFDTFKHDEA
jgi:RNA ligase